MTKVTVIGGTILIEGHLNLSKVSDVSLIGNKIYGTLTLGERSEIVGNEFI